MTDKNPYAAATVFERETPATISTDVPGKTRWRLIPVILCYVFGTIACGMGLLGLVSFTRNMFQPTEYPEMQRELALIGFVVMGIFFGFGIPYLLAGRMFWKKRYALGIVLCIVGIFISVTAGLIAEFLANARLSGARI